MVAANFMRSTTAQHKRGGDRGEGHLEADEDVFADHLIGEGRRGRIRRDPCQEELAPADVLVAFGAESEAIAPHHPHQHGQRSGRADLRHGGQHVLGTGQAAVEQRQARQDHEQDEDGGRHHPGVVAGIGNGRRGLGHFLREGRRSDQH
jgi:hypothetical protein